MSLDSAGALGKALLEENGIISLVFLNRNLY